MTELNLILSKNGQAQLADGSSTLNMGYEGTRASMLCASRPVTNGQT